MPYRFSSRRVRPRRPRHLHHRLSPEQQMVVSLEQQLVL